jgi:hypothetical protein
MAKLPAEVLIPGHGKICSPTYIPEMCDRIQEWIDAVNELICKGMTLEEVQKNFTFRDRYSLKPGREAMEPIVQKMNVTRLYEVLKDIKK